MPKRRKFQTIRGMRDILPQDMRLWQQVVDICQEVALAYGFSKIETPIVEPTELFRRSVGGETDIVKKEMFAFKDQGGDEVVLRPEMTASIVRAYIEHGLVNKPKPVKLYQIGRCFRYERPQSGRLRQFHQFNPEIIGSADPVTDAEIVAQAFVIFKELGLDVVMQVNSIGTPISRRTYIRQLKRYYQSKTKWKYLCKDCKQRFKTNPLRMLDCKKKKCVDITMDAPQIVDALDDESKEHLMKLLEYLDDFDLPYVLNPQIVRGLDYYTRTVFEIWMKDDDGARTGALGGGGRYDGLISLLGGRETPAIGFAIGIERIVAKLKEKNIKLSKEQPGFDIFLAQLGDGARKRAFQLFDELRSKGYKITFNLSKSSLKQQLDIANKAKAKLTLILGEKEVANNAVLIKEMDVGAQESVPIDKLEKELDKRLK